MDQQVMTIIIGAAIVTYLPRMLPLVVLSRTRLPAIFIRWLSYIPAAVLAALLAPALLVSEGKVLIVDNHYLLAAVPTFAVAVKTRNMALTIVTGMASIVVLGNWL